MADEDWKARFDQLVREAGDISLGIYPKAIQGGPNAYEERTEHMNGWNAAVMEHGKRFDEIVERARTSTGNESRALLLASGYVKADDGELVLWMNDTWAWACSDCERIPAEEVERVADLFSRWGWAGLLYWASKKSDRGRSEFKDINRWIDFVEREEDWIAKEPSSSKRAYSDISEPPQ